MLTTLGVQRATLVGLSAGAELATHFALAYPARVTRLVLASPGLDGYVLSAPLTWATPVFQAAAAGDASKAATLWAEIPIMALHSDTAAQAAVRKLVMSEVGDERREALDVSTKSRPAAHTARDRAAR